MQIHLRGTESALNEIRRYQLVQPQLIDFAVHVLAHVEATCGAVSQTPMTRVDVGVEFVVCEADETELEAHARQAVPSDWLFTGDGFLARPYLISLDSSLSQEWLSQASSMPVVYTAAIATMHHLLRVLDERLQASPSQLKCLRPNHVTHAAYVCTETAGASPSPTGVSAKSSPPSAAESKAHQRREAEREYAWELESLAQYQHAAQQQRHVEDEAELEETERWRKARAEVAKERARVHAQRM